ncbi:2-succinyl-5-enolpyruvyl-6-hydroxy-3-cyclohexene-1-carboxylate synthase [Terrabacter sp. Soil811]|uniref:2-succinyl-5-enolpyruvyl-6-hydroxy-3- cyclohexene-1-carboxylate synthase n=1 Tax=Terrabacter sp. Soil811 TaxID=1736419 RepID=UPI0006FF127D|nr:thiamine pyrophosphate-binding protein [Terrabacter sp. Soil811]KRF39067.1 2-succinyl-5-enolpyruvyl-6-hydroxy-3-cyclohexene-1-carboxylate synthase [Terrabacter sp. Soil811]
MTARLSAPEIALHVLQQLWLGGVRDVVLAPGSRSAPFALALDAADRAGDLRLHVRVDERSAGFLALGLATGSRRPVAVVTTSGTAVGNLLPAVMEAHHTGRRLVVVSADRPDHLRGTGANQTTDQAGIFGTFAPCHDLTAATPDDELAGLVAQACSRPGPTQLNVQLDGDLLPSDADPTTWWQRPAEEPSPPSLPTSIDHHNSAPADLGRDTGAEPHDKSAPADLRRETGAEPHDKSAPADVARAGRAGRGVEPSVSVPTDGEVLPLGPRTVVVAGDDAGPAARLLAEAAGWPLVAEPTSGARIGRQALRTGRLLLTTDLRGDVERVVVVGHPTLSRPVTSLISDPHVEVLSVRGRDGVATDPGRVARVLVVVPRVEAADAPAWFDAWRGADQRLGALIDAGLVAPEGDPSRAPGDGGLSPLAVAAVVGAAVAADTTLVVGSSNPVRDLDVMATPWTPLEHRFVVGNRGLAGIDGMVSTAVGVALGRPRAARSIAYLGDLTFLHDTNGLLTGRGQRRPDLTFVVLSDDGGAIFSTLEQGDRRYARAFERVFATPHGTDLEALCAAHHTAYERVDDLGRLAEALAESPSGTRVLEVPVSRADRRAEAAWLRELAQQVVTHRDDRR